MAFFGVKWRFAFSQPLDPKKETVSPSKNRAFPQGSLGRRSG
jgi:hypothetical protein